MEEKQIIKAERLEQLEEDKVKFLSILSKIHEEEIQVDSENFVSDKLKELDVVIKTLPDKTAKNKGNITMKEYLQNIKSGIEKNSADFVTKYKEKLAVSKIQIQERQEEINVEISNGS